MYIIKQIINKPTIELNARFNERVEGVTNFLKLILIICMQMHVSTYLFNTNVFKCKKRFFFVKISLL